MDEPRTERSAGGAEGCRALPSCGYGYVYDCGCDCVVAGRAVPRAPFGPDPTAPHRTASGCGEVAQLPPGACGGSW
ncbi:hypothetical protein TPA0598_04_07450 [Streptomyces lydicamycinicus]|uniref:Uncharacterized protein n=1 Tax=Streptomyces lydicamycinicus TaxID=1546107 RepID=A0A0P4R963_9ACTN|nr:hypothetical protein TPA0598_04_07450 [Streptomyces lydicamycinicus]